MPDKTKFRAPKKMSQEESDAYHALNSAIIRGYSPEVIEQLRKNFTTVQEKYKKPKIGEAVPKRTLSPNLEPSNVYPATRPIKIR